ncbi:MAG: hypothetical protein LiPW15_610 [Parcubacteria group bacterium LiPW_15]|nr:MAG: hypothetical protein LiPW15_610 [Parcubacteria group bacterium LiPW_15]
MYEKVPAFRLDLDCHIHNRLLDTREQNVPRRLCIVEVEKDLDRTLYERVVVVQEIDSEHYEVSFPDSGGKSNSIVEKKSVEFMRCPFSFGGTNILNLGLRSADSR